MYQFLIKKQTKIAVIGLGYVGLPLALAFGKKLAVIGFDINAVRITSLQQHVDTSGECNTESFTNTDIIFTDDSAALNDASFFIVTVPTPVDEHNVPDLSALIKASETIAAIIKKGDYVVFESTVYPGCTEEDCLPVIEKISGLKAGIDFKYGYSPERINPGDKINTIDKVIKVVSGNNAEALDNIAKTYELITTAGVYKAASVKVAESAKVIENTQRDLNIALMNELSIIFDRLGINTYDVLEAAGTKWNFLKFQPGLVGGHCIGVDPYYLTYKAAEVGFNSRVILAGRYVNDNMSNYLIKKILKHVIQHNSNVKQARVLVMGITFKENVSDIRNSKVADVVKGLQGYYLNVDVVDANANTFEVQSCYGFGLLQKPADNYDAVIIAVPHEAYKNLDDAYFASITKPTALIADLKGIYKNKINSRDYTSF